MSRVSAAFSQRRLTAGASSLQASSAPCVFTWKFFVAGARETDYPPCEEAAPNAEAAQAANSSSQPSGSKSAGGDAVLGGITVVGCEADGVAAVPQTASSQGDTGQWCPRATSATWAYLSRHKLCSCLFMFDVLLSSNTCSKYVSELSRI